MVEINLLPQQYRKQSQTTIWKPATWALLPITALALLIPWLMTSGQTSDLQRQIDAAQGDITAATAGKQEHDRLLAEQTQVQQTTSVAQSMRDQKTYWSNDIAAFSAQIPPGSGISLTKMTVTSLTPDELGKMQAGGTFVGKNVRRQFAISGSSASQQGIINLLNNLENNPNFGVDFQSMTQQAAGTDNGYGFSANVGVVGVPSAAQAQAAAAAPGTPGSAATGSAAAPGTAPAGTTPAGTAPAGTAPAPAGTPAPATSATPATVGTNVK